MNSLEEHFKIDFKPVAKKEAVVIGPACRFTILTSRLIRMEYDPAQQFEDRASQIFWYRDLSVPLYKSVKNNQQIDIETEYLHLTYKFNKKGFTDDSLSIKIKENNVTWHFGDKDSENLLGTARTLDGIDGEIELEEGLISRNGWSLVDDSNSLILNEQGWLEKREKTGTSNTNLRKDLYFFGYGHDYQQCLKDFAMVSGEVPLIPRWALGNWWSHFWEYSQDELKDLMLEFKKRGIPLSVCIIDMDWHIVQNEYTRGWTGYTWNRDLFPKPQEFISWLHKEGLKTALNLHPADGIHPHEDKYKKMAEFMGIDPVSKRPVEFDITNSKFIKGYFEILHHPLEEEGVDFWWIDWQQGSKTKLEGLDPLWALNHLHFYDRARDGDRRPFIFSRWGGLGHHRYQIGFSGDTTVSWDSLRFQPYFTSTASNVNYGWWSHDIGGHRMGQEDPELFARWVQFGVFSPIMRLHCTKNPYLDRRPWTHGEEAYHVIKEAMQLRHSFIPYLYTMAWRNHQESISLINPMYYFYPEREEAYSCPEQYFFGSELIIAPYLTPKDPDTNLSRQVVWLPKGDWFDFFNGEYYSGEKWYASYGELKDIPVFAKAGAIIPLGKKVDWGGLDNRQKLEIYIFPGADNSFELYEDEGESLKYKTGDYALTKFSQQTSKNILQFRIDKVKGNKGIIPKMRDYNLVFRGVKYPDNIEVSIDDKLISPDIKYKKEKDSLIIKVIGIKPDNEIKVNLSLNSGDLISKRDRRLEKIKKMLRSFKMDTFVKPILERKITDNINSKNMNYLKLFKPILKDNHFRTLFEVLYGVGIHRITVGKIDKIIIWNNEKRPNVDYQYCIKNSFNDLKNNLVINSEILDLKVWRDLNWRLSFNYFDFVSIFYDDNLK